MKAGEKYSPAFFVSRDKEKNRENQRLILGRYSSEKTQTGRLNRRKKGREAPSVIPQESPLFHR